MEEPGDPPTTRAAALVAELSAQQRVLAAAQARQAALMVEFGQVRRVLDDQRISDRAAEGIDPRYRPGEFAAMEIGLAMTTSRHSVQRTVAMARRLREETPDVWDAWLAGDIDQLKAARISHALVRLTRDHSKELLNALVLPVAVCKTAELLGRWLNQFVAGVEPLETDERLRRSFADRYASVRPDLDGISFLSAALSSVDATAIDQVLNALAGIAGPDDPRTVQQRRADALVDLLLGRTSNGCHVTWEEGDAGEEDVGVGHLADVDGDAGDEYPADSPPDDVTSDDVITDDVTTDDVPSAWDPEDDWDLPASAFRPDRGGAAPPNAAAPPNTAAPPDLAAPPGTGRPPDPDRPGRPLITRCPTGHSSRPLPVTVGVVVSVQSLLGYSDAPGQLTDRSALVPADLVRDLAGQPGTLFYQLLTDPGGNLLQVNELGRFPSRKLGAAIKMRDGGCANPVCTVPGPRCDLDHIVPVPHGPTSAANIHPKCRPDHRAKTHAGHRTTRDDVQRTTIGTTPTGHRYTTHDDPLPVEEWPHEHPSREGPTPAAGAS